jgi:hypothetical protein
MPPAVREDVAMQSGPPVLRDNAYAMDEIDVVAIAPGGSRCVLDLGLITVKNQNESTQINPVIRLSRVRALWSNRRRFPTDVREALAQHREAVMDGGPLTTSAESAVRVITEFAEGDPLGRH